MSPVPAATVLIGVFIVAAAAFWAPRALGFQAMYARTPVGEIEVKSLPERVTLRATGPGSYFSEDNRLFSMLFSYIKQNDVAMTVPVEAEVDSAEMRFFVGKKDLGRGLADGRSVVVDTLPERTVLSIGIGGAYSADNFSRGTARLEAWLQENPSYRATAPAYAVYWNGPYVPNVLKRSEVHVPIAPVDPAPAETGSGPSPT